jgi:pathogenesis-related protein 1
VGEPAALAGITLAHNEARAAVQTSPALPALTWSPALAATAAAWLAECHDTEAPIGLVDHNAGRSDGHPYYVGENIYASGGQADAREAVALWVGEKADYDYAANACNGTCGHYTQVVWRDTREVGCAVASCAGLQFPSTIVCDYGPGGNIGGQRPY